MTHLEKADNRHGRSTENPDGTDRGHDFQTSISLVLSKILIPNLVEHWFDEFPEKSENVKSLALAVWAPQASEHFSGSLETHMVWKRLKQK